jgi:predicted GNAT family acetyltransferase
MILTRYDAAAAFLARAQADLEHQEAVNNLILGIAARLAEHPDRMPLCSGHRIKTPPYLATVAEGSELLAAAVMTPPHRVIIHGKSTDSIPLRLITDDLIAGGWTAPGTIGPAEVAHAFAQVWTATQGGQFRIHTHERVYELRQVLPPAGVPGALRVAIEADLDLAVCWLFGFKQDARLDGTEESIRELAVQRIDDRDLFLWDAGRPVSLAGKSRRTTHGIAIGPVYTPPEFRRHGYAGALVAALSQQLLDAGWEFCALFTDLANPTSNSVYQKIGYRPVCDFDEYVFE